MKKISIGLLLPTSSIRPMAKEFESSLKETLRVELKGIDIEFEVISEMVGSGSQPQVAKAIDNLLGYHNVDLVAGIVTRYATESFLTKFEKRKVPFVFCNLGEQLMPVKGFNEHVIVNSIHLWQQAWLLGNYAARTFGPRGLVFSAMYDSGYGFSSMLQAGMLAANPDADLQFSLVPMPSEGELSAIQASLELLNLDNTDFIFPLFCGEEAEVFLQQVKKKALHKKLPILGLPFLLEFGEEEVSNIEIYTTHHDPQNHLEDVQYTSVFKNLGVNLAKAIANSLRSNGSDINAKSLTEGFKLLNENMVYNSMESPQITAPISVLHNTVTNNNQIEFTIAESKVLDIDKDENANQLRNGISANWMNPYLGV